MNENEARRLTLELLTKSEAVYLTTVNEDGYPLTRAMLNLRNTEKFPRLREFFAGHGEDFLVYFTTNTSSAKVRDILRHPKVSAYYCLPGLWWGVALAGRAELVEDPAEKERVWQPEWEMYYPGGVADPDNALLRLTPEFVRLYHQLDGCVFSVR